jgi:hypothetical protein
VIEYESRLKSLHAKAERAVRELRGSQVKAEKERDEYPITTGFYWRFYGKTLVPYIWLLL